MFPDNQVHIDRRVNGDTGDLLHLTRRAVNVEHSLVDSHLKPVPSVGALTTRRLPGGDAKYLCRDTDWSLGSISEVFSSGQNLCASLLEWFHVLALESHSAEQK